MGTLLEEGLIKICILIQSVTRLNEILGNLVFVAD